MMVVHYRSDSSYAAVARTKAFMLLVLELMKLSNSQSQTPRLAILHRAAALVFDGRIVLATNIVIAQPPAAATKPTIVAKVVVGSIPIVLALPWAITISAACVLVVSSRRRPVSIFFTVVPSCPLLSVLVWQTSSPALAVGSLVVVRHRSSVVAAWALRAFTLVHLCC
jgi:hypothetical protein